MGHETWNTSSSMSLHGKEGITTTSEQWPKVGLFPSISQGPSKKPPQCRTYFKKFVKQSWILIKRLKATVRMLQQSFGLTFLIPQRKTARMRHFADFVGRLGCIPFAGFGTSLGASKAVLGAQQLVEPLAKGACAAGICVAAQRSSSEGIASWKLPSRRWG